MSKALWKSRLSRATRVQHPAEPVLRIRLQRDDRADRGGRDLSLDGTAAQSDDRQHRYERKLDRGDQQFVAPARDLAGMTVHGEGR
jgi:hypothetical protein